MKRRIVSSILALIMAFALVVPASASIPTSQDIQENIAPRNWGIGTARPQGDGLNFRRTAGGESLGHLNSNDFVNFTNADWNNTQTSNNIRFMQVVAITGSHRGTAGWVAQHLLIVIDWPI